MNAPNLMTSRRLGQRLALTLLAGYKVLISPMFAGSCRFEPSCSEFARLAIIEHGCLKGTWLAVKRLARCHPAGPYGFDPVPPRITDSPGDR